MNRATGYRRTRLPNASVQAASPIASLARQLSYLTTLNSPSLLFIKTCSSLTVEYVGSHARLRFIHF